MWGESGRDCTYLGQVLATYLWKRSNEDCPATQKLKISSDIACIDLEPMTLFRPYVDIDIDITGYLKGAIERGL